jgi:hypothetical protein
MPTAVENILNLFDTNDILLFQSEASAQQLVKFGHGALNFTQEVAVASDFFTKQGDSFTAFAGVSVEIQDMVDKLEGSSNGAGAGAPADPVLGVFMKLEEVLVIAGVDLQKAGADLLGLQAAHGGSATAQRKANNLLKKDFVQLAKDFRLDQQLFRTIGADFVTAGKLDLAQAEIYTELGKDLRAAAPQFAAIAQEFHGLSQFFGSGGGGGAGFGGAEFVALGNNFLKLETPIQNANSLVGVLLPGAETV